MNSDTVWTPLSEHARADTFVHRSHCRGADIFQAITRGTAMRPILLSTLLLGLSTAAFATPQFAVKYDGRLAGALPDGRLFLILSNDVSNDGGEEPRMQVNDSAKTQQLFG